MSDWQLVLGPFTVDVTGGWQSPWSINLGLFSDRIDYGTGYEYMVGVHLLYWTIAVIFEREAQGD